MKTIYYIDADVSMHKYVLLDVVLIYNGQFCIRIFLTIQSRIFETNVSSVVIISANAFDGDPISSVEVPT